MKKLWQGKNESNQLAVQAYCERLAQIEAAEILAEAVESAGVSQRELARRTGKDPAEITRFFSGKRNLTLRSLAQCLAVLGRRLRLRSEPIEKPLSGIVLSACKRGQWDKRQDNPHVRAKSAPEMTDGNIFNGAA